MERRGKYFYFLLLSKLQDKLDDRFCFIQKNFPRHVPSKDIFVIHKHVNDIQKLPVYEELKKNPYLTLTSQVNIVESHCNIDVVKYIFFIKENNRLTSYISIDIRYTFLLEILLFLIYLKSIEYARIFRC